MISQYYQYFPHFPTLFFFCASARLTRMLRLFGRSARAARLNRFGRIARIAVPRNGVRGCVKVWKNMETLPRNTTISHIYILYIYIYIYMTIWQFEWGLNQSFYKHTMGYHRYMPQFYVNSTAMDCNMETMRNHWIVGQLLFGENQLVTMMERAAKF